MKVNKSAMGLYLVSDRTWHSEKDFGIGIETALKNGVTFLQIREKDVGEAVFLDRAKEMKEVASKYNVPFVINDNLDVMLASDADGIHVGQKDIAEGMGIKKLRKRVGDGKIIGVSVRTVEQALFAEYNGADYIGVGAVFTTSTKNDTEHVELVTLRSICEAVNIPVVAIGGISRHNILGLQGSGIDGVAVVSAILGQKDIEIATLDLARLSGQLNQSNVPKVLTIAGSDCSGGAGIQGDLKTIAAHGCYGMSVVTALTAQNTTGVFAIEGCQPSFVGEQIDCIFSDIVPHAVKIGMVDSEETIGMIVDRLSYYRPEHIVVDPVMMSTSGSNLIKPEAIKILQKRLLPIASIVTPNIAEAELLSGVDILNKRDMVVAAEKIADQCSGYILIKGGHSKANADDLLYKAGVTIWFEGKRIGNENTHGTGCTLSSAIASHLARGYDMEESVRKSKAYINGALKDALNLGRGKGPLNHFYDQ